MIHLAFQTRSFGPEFAGWVWRKHVERTCIPAYSSDSEEPFYSKESFNSNVKYITGGGETVLEFRNARDGATVFMWCEDSLDAHQHLSCD